MSRPPIFPDDDEGRSDFVSHMSRWAQSDLTMAEYFAKECGISETTVYATARRFKMSVPTNRKKEFREKELVLKEQNAGRVPLAVMAWRYNVREPTIYKWSRDVGLRVKGNTKKERRKWWLEYLADLDVTTAFEKFHQDRVPAHLAILAYHELFKPEGVLVWDMSTRPPRVLTEWTDEDLYEELRKSNPTSPEAATVIFAKDGIPHCSYWADETHIDTSPKPITKLRGQELFLGDRLIYLKPDGEEREVEFIGMQANGALRVRDLLSNARRGVQRQHLAVPE